MKTKLRSQVVPRFGMTLIELMVVTTIILMLVAISVPVVRPMLASRKQSDAAATLEVFLNQSKIRALETGRPCGVRFERYTDNNVLDGNTQVFPNNDVCIVMRQVEVPPPYAGNSMNSMVLVNRSSPFSADLIFTDTTEYAFWNQMVSTGDKIQFDNQGPYYSITSATMNSSGEGVRISGGYGANASPIRDISQQAVSFKVLRAPQPTLTAPVGFPTGIVVDLQYSGMKDGDPAGPVSDPTSLLKPVGDFGTMDGLQEGQGFTAMDKTPVVIMFSPAGDVMSYQKGDDGPLPPNESIHFLIGRWERSGNYWAKDSDGFWHRCETAIDAENRGVPFYLPDDNLRNYADLSNFWVTINPRTGSVSTNPVAPHDGTGKNPLGQSRAYSRTPQFNMGGQ